MSRAPAVRLMLLSLALPAALLRAESPGTPTLDDGERKQLEQLASMVAHRQPGEARATVLTCAVDTLALPKGPRQQLAGPLFVVEGVGNQVAGAAEALNYGVRHLHTPLLLVVGDGDCVAVRLAAADDSRLEAPARQLLAGLTVPKGIDRTDGALLNINNQVEAATLNFSGEVEAGRLAVIGVFYDAHNTLRHGGGKLVVTNINGETDPAKIRRLMRRHRFFSYAFMEAVKQ